jgi:hypothetical protein
MIGRFQSNGWTYNNFSKLIDYLNMDSCPVVNTFFDWNPIYKDDFKLDMLSQPSEEIVWALHKESQEADDTVNPWRKL